MSKSEVRFDEVLVPQIVDGIPIFLHRTAVHITDPKKAHYLSEPEVTTPLSAYDLRKWGDKFPEPEEMKGVWTRYIIALDTVVVRLTAWYNAREERYQLLAKSDFAPSFENVLWYHGACWSSKDGKKWDDVWLVKSIEEEDVRPHGAGLTVAVALADADSAGEVVAIPSVVFYDGTHYDPRWLKPLADLFPDRTLKPAMDGEKAAKEGNTVGPFPFEVPERPGNLVPVKAYSGAIQRIVRSFEDGRPLVRLYGTFRNDLFCGEGVYPMVQLTPKDPKAVMEGRTSSWEVRLFKSEEKPQAKRKHRKDGMGKDRKFVEVSQVNIGDIADSIDESSLQDADTSSDAKVPVMNT